jgi:hypothetical protein
MHRTRIVAMALLVPVVAVVAAMLIASPSDAAPHAAPGLDVRPPVVTLLAAGGNRGW